MSWIRGAVEGVVVMVAKFKPFDLVVNVLVMTIVWFSMDAMIGRTVLTDAFPATVFGLLMGWVARSAEQ